MKSWNKIRRVRFSIATLKSELQNTCQSGTVFIQKSYIDAHILYLSWSGRQIDTEDTSLCYSDEVDDSGGCKDDRAAKYWDKISQILGHQVQRDANLKSSDRLQGERKSVQISWVLTQLYLWALSWQVKLCQKVNNLWQKLHACNGEMSISP